MIISEPITKSPWLQSAANSNISLYPDDIIVERGKDGTIDPKLTPDVIQEGLRRYTESSFIAFNNIGEALGKSLNDETERIKGSKGIQYNTTVSLLNTITSPPFGKYFEIQSVLFNRVLTAQDSHAHRHMPSIFSLGYAPKSTLFSYYGNLILQKPVEPYTIESVCDRFLNLNKPEKVESYIPEGQEVDNPFFVVIDDGKLLHAAEESIPLGNGPMFTRRISFICFHPKPADDFNKEIEESSKYRFINAAISY